MPLATFTGSSTLTSAATTTNVDITGAPTGDWVYAFIVLDASQTSVTMTGWTQILQGPEPVASPVSYYALFRRKKVAGDTTFAVTWTSSAKGTFGLIAYTGLDPTTPDEGAVMALHTTGTTYPTSSITPSAERRWAVTFTYSRTSTTANKAIAFTPDAALTEKLDFNNSAAASSPWVGQEIADSNGMVTVAAHSYTATQAFAETHGGAIVLYLIPAAPNLLAAYNFDEASGNVLDRTGNGHDFALSGNTVRTASGGGHTAYGLTQSANDTLAGPSLTGLQTISRTWMTWIKFAAAVNGWILEFHQLAADTGVWGLLDISGTLRFRAKDSTNTAFDSPSINRNLGTFQHIAATYDGVNVRVYINGALFSTTAMATALWTGDLLRVLDQTSTSVVIDDVRFYDQALDAASITSAMNTPVPSPAGGGFSGWGIPL